MNINIDTSSGSSVFIIRGEGVPFVLEDGDLNSVFEIEGTATLIQTSSSVIDGNVDEPEHKLIFEIVNLTKITKQ